jgi:DNA-binding response OmpR family regulator
MTRKMNFETVPLASLDLTKINLPRPTAGPAVLIVDDESVVADTLGMILELSGYRVSVAYDGISALKLSETVPLDLLLTDVCMPGMSGIDLAINIQRRLPHCKILMFSGHASASDLYGTALLERRGFTILAKPLHPAELLSRLSESLQPRDSAVSSASQIDGSSLTTPS